jgi:monoamine oxidase
VSLLGFIEGKEARVWARRTPAERQEAVTGCFVRYFGPAVARPARYVERDWIGTADANMQLLLQCCGKIRNG